jgi:hypothetical protein
MASPAQTDSEHRYTPPDSSQWSLPSQRADPHKLEKRELPE